MTGKEKCELLRQIRKEIADKNGIQYDPVKCNHVGDCAGTCPVCDMEVKYLDAQLNKKAEMGGKLNVAGVSLDHIKTKSAFAIDGNKRLWSDSRPIGRSGSGFGTGPGNRPSGITSVDGGIRPERPVGRGGWEVPPMQGQVLPPVGRKPTHITQTMGIILPPQDIVQKSEEDDDDDF